MSRALAALTLVSFAGGASLARAEPDGVALVEKYECARCHDGLPGKSFPTQKHCVHCHQEILGGSFQAPIDALRKWQRNLHSLNVAPSLGGSLLRREWIVAFLQKPHDVRPNLPATMPRLPLGADEARVIARVVQPVSDAPELPRSTGDVDRGRALYERFRCGSCHRFSGASADAPIAYSGAAPWSIALAPDLRETRDRVAPASIAAWVVDPASRKPGTLMPKLGLTEAEGVDLARFIVQTPLEAPPSPPRFERLPVLARRVTWDEVNDKVFRRTCWHCHSQPDYALGDGGPGNTGGFGFAPRGLDLATATGASSGAFDEQGRRRSIFAPLPDGTPRLLGVLLARHHEQRGQLDPTVRGMPLGLPALTAAQIQLVESWIAQGRPR